MSLDIELIPALEHSSIQERLEKSLSECIYVKGAVAYWTIDTNFIPELLSVLSKEESYYCIDIHKPTDIDCLADFKKMGANIFLHNYEFIPLKEKQSGLLHSKIILLELRSGQIEIWLGSHNFTRRAILGINIESSFLITTTKDNKIYKDVLTYLDFIKENCIPFNTEDVDFYKLLQGEDDSSSLVLDLNRYLNQTRLHLATSPTKPNR
jgi:hypothetical protein